MNSDKLNYYLDRTNHNLTKISLRLNNKYYKIQKIEAGLNKIENLNNKYFDLNLEGSGDGSGVKRLKKDIASLKKSVKKDATLKKTVKKDIDKVKKSLKKDIDAVKKQLKV